MSKKEWKEKLELILKDKKSGSSIIAERIANLFKILPDSELYNTAKKLLSVHSSMGAVINRVNYLCLVREGKNPGEIKNSEDKVFAEFWEEHYSKRKWITISMSHWVTELLKRWKDLYISIGISYPQKEGLITANILSKYHNVEVLEDCALVSEVEEADGIIVGADLITNDFIINKIGTYFLALSANYFHKPVFVISSGDKYLTKELSYFFKIKTYRRGLKKTNIFESIPRRLIHEIKLVSPPYMFEISDCLKKLVKEIK